MSENAYHQYFVDQMSFPLHFLALQVSWFIFVIVLVRMVLN